MAVFDRALAIQPNMAEGLYNRGVALADLQRFEMAVESYDRALALQPEMVAAMVNRAVALAAMQRFDDAIAGYDRVLAMQPSNVWALVQRGLVHRALGRPSRRWPIMTARWRSIPRYGDANIIAAWRCWIWSAPPRRWRRSTR